MYISAFLLITLERAIMPCVRYFNYLENDLLTWQSPIVTTDAVHIVMRAYTLIIYTRKYTLCNIT